MAGVLRCYAVEIMQSGPDLPWNFGRGFIWSSIEPSLGIISACLPTLRPLVRYIFPSGFGRSKNTSEFYRLQERERSQPVSDSTPRNAHRGSEDSEAPFGKPGPPFSITVQQDLEISSKSSREPA